MNVLIALTAACWGILSAEGPAPAIHTSHWSYQVPRPQAVPRIQLITRPAGRIDAFILAKLETTGHRPAPETSPYSLLRRLSFDLRGLPPTVEELRRFASQPGEEGYRRFVDQWLDSPHFGEHWARHWFDIVRFGESVTLRGFIFKQAWRYRDYVIDSINADVPWNRFLTEQIAGDLLPWQDDDQRQRQLIAATFWMLGNTNLEEQDKKQLEMDVVDEQLDVLGKAFLGQTISCARCHDHKFDPIPTSDYYALAGILKSMVVLKHDNVSAWVEQPLPLAPEKEAILATQEAQMASIESQLKALKSVNRSSTTRLPVIQPSELPGIVVDSSQARRVGSWTHSQHVTPYVGDGYLHDGNAMKGASTLTFLPELKKAGRYEVRFAYTAGDNRAGRVPVTVFHADGETVNHVDQRLAPSIENRFVSLGTYRFETTGFSHVLVGNDGTAGHVVADAVQLLPVDEPSTNLAFTSSRPAAPAAGDMPEISELEAKLRVLKSSGFKRPMAMAPALSSNLIDLPIHQRGSVHRLGERVPRGFLSAAPIASRLSIPKDQGGRLQLAQWMVDASNPLTARVLVNRVWLWLMGEGLVRTPDNFGTTGEPPTHPELLDDLALRFASGELNWSLKALVREIVMSRTYRAEVKSGGSIDPENRLWASALPKRLHGEQLRDAMLHVAGAMDLQSPRGPSFPANRSADFDFQFASSMRSVYLPWFRNAAPDILAAFDALPASTVVGRRDRSIVPAQGLFMMNHEFAATLAQLTAFNLLKQHPDATEASLVEHLYLAILGREPTPDESRIALQHLREARSIPPKAKPPSSALNDRSPMRRAHPGAARAWGELIQALFGSPEFRIVR